MSLAPQPITLQVVERDALGRCRTYKHTERRDLTFQWGFAGGVFTMGAVALLVIWLACSIPVHAESLPGVTPCFMPSDVCERLVIQEIDHARTEILVQQYEFTNRAIIEALKRARDRGVDVYALVDVVSMSCISRTAK